MASCLLKNTTILSILLLLFLNTPKTQSTDIEDEDDDEVYVLDHPLQNSMSRSRFLTTVIRKVEFLPTMALACSTAARNTAGIFLEIRIIAANAATSASSESTAAMEYVLMLLLVLITVASAIANAPVEFPATMVHVGMLN
ncbi:conserved hypothetical protein [Ricinus communis]|uniref:Uncharacterized protein n=1 Tax=Ricinus communis TaxID=3988 RepID=B9T6N5_RICCO|nr:conserved hypothetical protein [Ricinus communis]